MEVESKQAEVLEQFCLLAKSARGRALVELISNATSDPNLFAFGELLDVPQIKQLADSEHAASLELLKLFAFGTWPQYKKRASELPPLNQAQSQKLKQLTVVTLAESSKVLPYDVLMAQLDIGNVRELEDLLINDCMYTGIVRGKLDQKRRCFEVQFAVGRDLRPGQLESMMDSLADWLACSESLLSTIEERIQWADEMGKQRARTTKEVEEKAEEVKRSVVMEINLRQETMFGDFSGPSAMQYRMDEGEERVRPKRSAIRRR